MEAKSEKHLFDWQVKRTFHVEEPLEGNNEDANKLPCAAKGSSSRLYFSRNEVCLPCAIE